MAYKFVKTGAAAASSSGGSVTPAFGGPPAANNLLISWCGVTGTGTLPTAPAGWSMGPQLGTAQCSSSIFYKTAAGGDSNPTFSGIPSGTIRTQLGEFSGNATAFALDRSGTASTTTTSRTVSTSAADVASQELVILAVVVVYNPASTPTLTNVPNNGLSWVFATNTSGNNTVFLQYAWGVTATGGVADSNAWSTSTSTNLSNVSLALASFKLAPVLTEVINWPQATWRSAYR